MSPSDQLSTGLYRSASGVSVRAVARPTKNRLTILRIALVFAIAIVGCSRCHQSQVSTKSGTTDEMQSDRQTDSSMASATPRADSEGATSAQSMPVTNVGPSDHDSDQPVTGENSTATDSLTGNSTQRSTNGKAKNSEDATVARKNVVELRQKANQARSRNEPGAAFRLSVAAWDEARLYPNDPQLRTATDELAVEIKRLSQQANEKHNAASETMSVLVEK